LKLRVKYASTMVQQLAHDPEIKGSSPATTGARSKKHYTLIETNQIQSSTFAFQICSLRVTEGQHSGRTTESRS
jgi:hypothetical protein